jgi:mono/diheme cytochrome c family protein
MHYSSDGRRSRVLGLGAEMAVLIFDATLPADEAQLQRGEVLFNAAVCAACHTDERRRRAARRRHAA